MSDLVLYESPTSQALAMVEPAYELAQKMAMTTFVPAGYRGKPNELLAAILTGNELGLGPMTAMAKIFNIEGKAGIAAELMRALPLSHGHVIWVEEASSTKVTVAGHRKGDPEHVSRMTWTADMVKRAGLEGKANHRKYPQAMLLARATGDLCRTIFADCLSGISYTVEELQDGIDLEEPVEGAAEPPPDGVSPPPPPASNARKSSATKKAAAPARKKAEPAAPPADPIADFDDIDGAEPAAAPATEPAPAAASDRPVEDRRSDAVRIKTEEVLGEVDRDERLAFWTACLGREATSGKDLTSTDAETIFANLELIETGDASWEGGELVHTPDAEGNPAAEEAGWSVEGWKEWREGISRNHADLIRAASAVAKEMGVDPPSSLQAIVKASPAFKAKLKLALEGGG